MMEIPEKVIDFVGEHISSAISVGGGCIATSFKLLTVSGEKFFLKTGVSKGMFELEAEGLRELAKVKVIRIPEVFLVGEDCLLLEFIESGRKKEDFFEKFGEQYAQLHKCVSDSYGFVNDNFIGMTPQVNPMIKKEEISWVDYYWTNRLMFQYRLAEKNGYVDSCFLKCFNNLESKIHIILAGSEERPTLMHGDLWSGNYMCDINGDAVLFDPAVYYGHRELDLAMTYLFGGFSSVFYKSYNLSNPLKQGSEYRRPIYLLYHVLNHLNLFGRGYYSQAIELMERYK